MNQIQQLTATIDQCRAHILANSARAYARFQELRERRQARVPNTLRNMIAGEDLPRWTHPPRSFEVLPNGEVLVHGDYSRRTQRKRTLYLRSNYNIGDVAMLRQIVGAQRSFTAEQVISRTRKGLDATTASKLQRIREGRL